jgi:hypothetical protein
MRRAGRIQYLCFLDGAAFDVLHFSLVPFFATDFYLSCYL